MNTLKIKDLISPALKNFSHGTIKNNAIVFFNVLGYDSQKRIDGDTPAEFIALLDGQKFHQTNALFNEWQSVSLLFQLTDEEMSASGDLFSVNQKIDNAIIESYLFFAITLQEKSYSRTALSKITREINKLFHKPVLVLFEHGETLTLAIINRRLHKRDESKDVLEKVTLIKDINFNNPHRAHVEILCDFSLEVLRAQNKRLKIDSFVALHQAWEKVLNTSELNKRFFKEIADWYFWAVQSVTFPKEAGDDETRNHINVIRLITRLIFVWFLKERGLIPATLFDKSLLGEILYYKDAKGSTYYKAILQNLFFATLNQEMNTLDKPNNRMFRGKGKIGQRDQHYLVHNVYRYEGYFRNAKDAFDVFANIPFLNGGLFECLDKKIKVNGKETVLRIDGFSERTDNEICVPDILFFTETPQSIDLNAAYGTKNKKYQVQGIINIFNRYKFTIAENTPIEEEIALDPELLGKVFENLLAAYNPETGTTARKQTGSFYTPREIVNYMVDESLIAYLENQLLAKGKVSENQQINTQLRTLVGYNEENHSFNEDEVQQLITAIDQIKMLDPACGSGAFPMGGLHKLVSILSKLDPNNARWKEQQIAKAKDIPDSTFRDKAIEDIEQAFSRNELDYGRKLYLIQNGIFGIDIQPIAVQIAKLRFFISLLVDQRINESRENRGVRPLPNLETKFVAANTLIGLEKPAQATLRNLKIDAKEKELTEVRASYFTAQTPKTKNKYRERDEHIRAEISELLLKDGFPRDTTERLAKWNPYDQNASADFFDASLLFGVSDGFDVVIGNPPYIKEYTCREAFNELRNSPYYQGKMDLWYFFACKSIDILKQNTGVLSFIATNNWVSNSGASILRNKIVSDVQIIELIDFGNFKIFESADIQTMILICTRNHLASSYQFDLRKLNAVQSSLVDAIDILHKNSNPKAEYLTPCFVRNLLKDNHFLFSTFIIENSLNKLYKKANFRLDKKKEIAQGIVTPQDSVNKASKTKLGNDFEVGDGIFILSDIEKNAIPFSKNELRLIKPFYTTVELGQYFGEKRNLQWVIYTDSSFKNPDKVKCYPNIKKHLDKFQTVITSANRPYGLHRCRNEYFFQGEKIVSVRKCAEPTFTYTDFDCYVSQTFYVIKSKRINMKYLTCLLNSKVISFWLKHKGKMQGHQFQVDKEPLLAIPIRQGTPEQQKEFMTLVDKILTTKRSNSKADTSALEAQIEQLVYQLYGLTDEEIKIVEEQRA